MNRCDELGLKHAWEDTTPNIVYPTNPPQYPNHQQTCQNCGLKKTLTVTEKWEYRERGEK